MPAAARRSFDPPVPVWRPRLGARNVKMSAWLRRSIYTSRARARTYRRWWTSSRRPSATTAGCVAPCRRWQSTIGHDAHVEQVGEWVTVEIFKADRHAEAHKRVVVAVLEVDPEREIIKGGDLYVEP